MPLISVIIPCYNVEKYIDRCLESIINQTIGYENLEILCIDDCSTDNTLNLLLNWEKKYPDNIGVIKCEQNGRQGQARNIGLTYASSEWIGFIDSDDWIEKEYFELLYNIAKDNEYQLVCCDYKRDSSDSLSFFNNEANLKENSDKDHSVIITTDNDRKNIILNPVLGYNAWAKLISKSFLLENDISFPENITYEDAFWGSLLHLYFNKAYKIETPLYHYFVNSNSTVLASNSLHHFDIFTAQTLRFSEWQKRGFLDKYKEELQIEQLYSLYLSGLKMLILRYSPANYNGYLLLRQLIIESMPDYEDNYYIKNGILEEKYKLALTALKYPLNNSEFLTFAENMKKIGM